VNTSTSFERVGCVDSDLVFSTRITMAAVGGVNKVITRATETGRNAATFKSARKRRFAAVYQLRRDVPKPMTGAFNPKVAGSIPARPIQESPAKLALASPEQATIWPGCQRKCQHEPRARRAVDPEHPIAAFCVQLDLQVWQGAVGMEPFMELSSFEAGATGDSGGSDRRPRCYEPDRRRSSYRRLRP
jgi:hypothetical protein